MNSIDFTVNLINKTNDTFYYSSIQPNYFVKINKLALEPNDTFIATITVPYDTNIQASLLFDKTTLSIWNFIQLYTGASAFEIPLNDEKYKSNITYKKKFQPMGKLLQVSEVTLEILNK